MAVPLSQTSGGQLHKYAEAVAELIEGSMSMGESLPAAPKPGSFSVKDNKVNRATLEQFIKLAKSTRTEPQAHALQLEVKGSKPTRTPGIITFGQINKPPTKPSRGDIGEAVIAAAICARFVYKHGRVTPQMVIGIMKTLGHKGVKTYPGKTGKYVENTFKSKNEGVKILDDVHCYISLNLSAITASLNPRSEYGQWAYKEVIPAYARSACSYVNSGKVSQWAETVYKNRRYDLIDIRSDGLGDQKGTKVDTRVKITNDKGKLEPVNINLSMKVDDVKQFGQVSGLDFTVQQELWKQLCGYTTFVTNMEPEYNKKYQEEHDIVGAVNLVYDKVAYKLNQDLRNDKEGTLETLAKGITYFATRHEEHVEVLNLGKGGTKLYKFDELYDGLLGAEDFQVTIRDQKEGYRQIDIKAKSIEKNRVMGLLSIRLRVQPKSDGTQYIRNLIEKSKVLGELVAESLD